MTTQKKILVAIDDSRQTKDTIRYAALMAATIGSLELILFHVQPGLSTYLTDEAKRSVTARRALEKVMRENEKRSTEIVESAAEQLVEKGAKRSAIQIMTLPKDVGVADDILAYGGVNMVDAILVGRRGAFYLKQWLMGSVTANLVENSKVIPIWVVDGSVSSDKILMAADGSQSALRALDHLAFMLSGQPSLPIHLVHVQPVMRDYCEIDLTGEDAETVTEVLVEVDKYCIDDFYAKAVTLLEKNGVDKNRLKLTTLEKKLSVPRSIMGYAKDNGYGAVVMGRRGSGTSSFFGSVSRRLLQVAENMAIWIVP